MSASATAETEGERRILAVAPSGELVSLVDLSDEQRVVSANVIRRLCVGTEAKDVDPRGVRIKGAHVVEALDLSYCAVSHPLRFQATTFDAVPDLSWARLPALWITDDCSLPGLTADGIGLDGDLQLSASEVTGEVSIVGAQIGGRLKCDGATFSDKGRALSFDRAEINSGVFLRDKFSAAGEVRLVSAKIGGDLSCRGATLINEGSTALLADGAEINGSVFLRDKFSATGEVRLPAAKIGRDLDCDGATLSNKGRTALEADGAEINGSVLLRNKFSATGEVRLPAAKIGRNLDCDGATLSNKGRTALLADGAEINGSVLLRDTHIAGGVNLFRASAGILADDLGHADDSLGSWSGVEPLVLDGFAYTRFATEASWDSKRREQWLRHTTQFEHGAWHQLIEVFRAHGRKDQANRAAIAMHKDRLERAAGLPWYRRAGRWILGVVVGHGYQPWRAGIWAVAIIAGFAAVVWLCPGAFVPTTSSPQPVAYAADTFLPIIDLGQASDWTPTGWVRWVDWSVILLGWALTTLFVAGFTRIVRSE